ncbi:hypothetical protein Y1Q_0012328 [Alligator mississippiensis]|uniref:Uncharacterized protein n=1 Tax=Alligator mississippiensis TaxID=8496 RepID=A0A151M574_ALLMI|nr:hypothetical protein Y1Q_0012328 [Alligator mississippiensis]
MWALPPPLQRATGHQPTQDPTHISPYACPWGACTHHQAPTPAFSWSGKRFVCPALEARSTRFMAQLHPGG